MLVKMTMWMDSSVVLLLLILFCHPQGSAQGRHERRLLNQLLKNYNAMERPVANESEPLILSFGLTLQQLIDVVRIFIAIIYFMDEKSQIITSNLWLNMEWIDSNLSWNSSQYGGIKDIRMNPKFLWKPDILMYNSADERIDSTIPTNVVVQHNGTCTYIPPGIFKSTCKIDIMWFPFDDQQCIMKFGSWTYDGRALDLRLYSEEADMSAYIDNGEWILLGFRGKRNVIFYTCCPEPYVDITFTLHIRRRTLYHGFNLIIPCVLISSMALLGFALPPDSGEKLTLGVTILLSLTVFMLQLAQTLPPTSDAVSIIGTYFACTMIMVAFSVVMTVVVLNYHHRNSDTHEMPQCIKTLFLKWLPFFLRMKRRGRKTNSRHVFFKNKMKELDRKERSSRSLIANVLDIDDDFRSHNSTTSYLSVRTNEETVNSHVCGVTQKEISTIIRELRFITNRLKTEDEATVIINEWKFAAMVMDRVCLILFTLFTLLSTFACLFTAPHLVA
ncbi:neuronal acetylcholine receptor subunit alpha-7-like isoform X1 [Limulus polyphemus]|uniref:Neuronal acetylcholine receptor subunit alpha-7-like isoform X1 n=2 Tax=Limulus polyphemus TaxID=6850 RepID=A0ABM1TP62_LIMPO|nr:neuronal acetylcholine receptor subunit alpha-7-like isoform X1 [Limulus polyphemus]